MEQLTLFSQSSSNWDFDFHLRLCHGDLQQLKESMEKALAKYEACQNKTDKVLRRMDDIKAIINKCK